MKNLLIAIILLFTLISAKTIQENQTVTAKYLGYEDGSYSFESNEGELLNFDAIYDVAEQKFDLESEKNINKTFVVTYETSIEESEELEEKYETNSISDLEISE